LLTLDDGTSRPPLGEVLVTVAARSVATAPLLCTFAKSGEVRLRYDLFEQPSGRLLYTTTVTHTVPEPLALDPAQRVVYLSHPAVTGRWTVALNPAKLSASRLEFSLAPLGPAVTMPLTRGEGYYSLPAAKLTPGTHHLRARLVQGGHVVGQADYALECLAGPFARAR
jgi:hypothetical protein